MSGTRDEHGGHETADPRTAQHAVTSRGEPVTLDPAETPVPLLNIANVLTMLRIALVPVFLALLFAGDGHEGPWRMWAFVVFAVAAVTDRIDGQLARRHGLVTDFGKIADPIADKALMGSALVGLSALGDLPWWVTVVILARELGITALRFAVLRHAVIPAGRGGKLKTLVQTFAIGLFVLPLPDVAAFHVIAWILMGAAVVLTVATGLDYVVQAIRLRAGVHRVEAGDEPERSRGDAPASDSRT
ncbi:CDP-diacylglycerol--glycerol-3-phosphate 3-phosphatidyltransferase [Rhodococcus rhodnii]|nr:CDP-diacylglycerol--glycerol-3-phosphate 3-phosphatidyltransferase [Rhodococcus rhodnii]TXG92648.1 CDP-diacylglycerol--glycerol-3-phosphate 3-phosphatidyltransferase [Rhodococcus rhodnii]